MRTYKLFLLPETLNNLYLENTIDDFLFKLENIYKFLHDNGKFLKAEIHCELNELIDLDEIGIYSIKSILGYFLDTTNIFQKINSQTNPCYCYYQIENIGQSDFQKINTPTYLEIFESTHSHYMLIKIISEFNTKSICSILKVPQCNPKELPILKSIDSIFINHLIIDIFFETMIKPIFHEMHADFIKFKNKYFEFYDSFDWLNWLPNQNPCPGHFLISELSTHHRAIKQDAYLLQWGVIMAFINCGRFNKPLTQLNGNVKNINYIFQSGVNKGNNTQFFSIDTENGTLEIYDYQGKHTNQVYGIKIGVKKQIRNYKIEAPKAKWLDYYI